MKFDVFLLAKWLKGHRLFIAVLDSVRLIDHLFCQGVYEGINNPVGLSNKIASEKGANQSLTPPCSERADAGRGNLGLPKEAYGNAFQATSAKKPKLILLDLEILKAGTQAVIGLEIVAKR